MALLDGLRERMVRERARFIEDYEDNIDQARLDLGKLFSIEDYPSKEALQGKFGIRYRITPVPDADHFMAKLASDDTDRVKRDIEQPGRGTPARCRRRPLPPSRRGRRSGLASVCRKTAKASPWCSAIP